MGKLTNVVLAIDYDSTIAINSLHNGRMSPGIITDDVKEVVQGWDKDGAKIILNTMRSGPHLVEAAKHFETETGVKLLSSVLNPTQHKWTTSPKTYADFYIDDRNVGCILMETNGEKHVDFKAIDKLLRARVN